MRAERRLAKLEASLPPRAAVLHWLAEVHEHGSLDAYLAGIRDEPASSPLVALIERITTAVRSAHAREPRSMVREAEHRAVMDTVFLCMLVLELEHEATEAIRIGTLRLEALRWESRARTAEGAADRRGWAAWRASLLELATDVARTEAVRGTLADRYLDGRETLSPASLSTWGELREGVAALVATIRSLPGARRRRPPDIDVVGAAMRTAPDEARALADRVRARTLDLLGDHAGAMATVGRVYQMGSGKA